MIVRAGSTYYEPFVGTRPAGRPTFIGASGQSRVVRLGSNQRRACSQYQFMMRIFGTKRRPTSRTCPTVPRARAGGNHWHNVRGAVSATDFEQADLIVIAGGNPGTTQTRMLSVRKQANTNGAKEIPSTGT